MNFQQKIITDKKEGGLFYRVGLGSIGPIVNSFLFTAPMGLQYKLSRKFEIGSGITFFYLTDTGFEGPGFFISFAYYVNPSFRIMISPFFANRLTIKYHFGLNQPILPFGGIDGILIKKKK